MNLSISKNSNFSFHLFPNFFLIVERKYLKVMIDLCFGPIAEAKDLIESSLPFMMALIVICSTMIFNKYFTFPFVSDDGSKPSLISFQFISLIRLISLPLGELCSLNCKMYFEPDRFPACILRKLSSCLALTLQVLLLEIQIEVKNPLYGDLP